MPEAVQKLPRDPEELRAIIAQTTTRQAEKDGVRGHMDCWAHVRRKAVEGANSQTKTGSAHAFVTLIGKLY